MWNVRPYKPDEFLSDCRLRYFGGSHWCSLDISGQLCSECPEQVLHVPAQKITAFVRLPLFFSILLRETKVEQIHSGEACLYYCFTGYFEVWVPLGFFLSWLFDLFASYSDFLD